MTEKVWLESADPSVMLDRLATRASPRRLRLFATACCLQTWEAFEYECDRDAILVAEQFADQLVGEEVRFSAEQNLAVSHDFLNVDYEFALNATYYLLAKDFSIRDASLCVRTMSDSAPNLKSGSEASQTSLLHEQANNLRDIFGNPFRPVSFDPRWRTSDVVDVARGIYEDKAFERMPILADALMDAGCEDEQIIGHCRGEGPHVRGCWVVDLVLGKE